jgi:hypothetical protein
MAEICRNRLLARQSILTKALSHSDRIVYFAEAEQGSHISASNGAAVETIALDSLDFGRQDQLFIKLDVEGAESDALDGADKTILKHRPLMAICIYHKQDDLWSIPFTLMNRYSFYIRHHSSTWYDTVLYCIPTRGKYL